MKNPFKNIKRKACKIAKSPVTKTVVTAVACTLVGTSAYIGVGLGLARIPVHFGVKIVSSLLAYTIASEITEQVVDNEMDRFQETIINIPNPPKL